MWRAVLLPVAGLLLACLVACGDEPGQDQDAGPGPDSSPYCVLTLPQAVSDAMWANPEVYASIPVRVRSDVGLTSVSVALDGDEEAGVDNGGNEWIATLPIGDVVDGTYVLTASGQIGDVVCGEVEATLALGREGVQLTFFDDHGFAGTPRLHRVGPDAWLTWTATHDGHRAAWMQRIDGAGRLLGDRIPLVDFAADTLYARTAFGNSTVGVLYQRHGQPYTNHLRVVDLEGNEIHAATDLDPPGWLGRPYGDIAYDGSGFVAVYRVNDASWFSEIHWIRADETTGDIAGPVVVAETGDGTPFGGFEPFVRTKIAAQGDVSIVTFVRHRYHPWLEMTIPRAQLARLRDDGTLERSAYAGQETGLTYDWDCRVAAVDDGFVVLWSLTDLTDPADDPPALFHGTRLDSQGALDPDRGAGSLMLRAPYDRAEPFLLQHPVHSAVLAWTDLRSVVEHPPGGIELWVAPVDGDLAVQDGDTTVFPHARFHFDLGQLHATGAGTNVLLTWLDERHGGGIMDPRPEVFFETAWY